MAYLRLFDPTTQFQLKNGALNVSGRLFVYLSETDDLAPIFDENGTQLQQPAILDNNGRARGLFVDADKVYWMDVQDMYGGSLFTIRHMTPMGGGGGGSVLGNTEIISTDGSISIEKYTEAGETTYDIGIAPQSDEFLEWCNCSEDNISNGTWYPAVLEGTMESQVGYGLHVNKGQLYHITTNIKVDPTGAGINYDTLSANLMFNDGEDHNVVRRNYDVDSSVNDPTLCEFSYDFVPENDGYIYLDIEGVGYFEHVSVSMQVHRVYSGVNAVPDTCATKQWVSANYQPQSSMSSYMPYSALEYNGSAQITGIAGSAIGGQVDPNDFIPWSASGQFAPSGNYLDASASSMFQPSGSYVYESAYSSFSSNVTNNITSLSSTVSGMSSNMSAYLPLSGLQGDGTSITAIEGSAIGGTATGGKTYSGIAPIVVDNTADTIGIQQLTLTVDSSMTSYYSGDSAVLGVNTTAIGSSIASGKLDASASSLFYSTSNPSGFITGVDLTPYQTTAGMTAYQPAGNYQPSGDYIFASALGTGVI